MMATPPIPASAEVVIVGGGVIGASIAFHLAEAGVTDVVLLERDTLGSGASSKGSGAIRQQFSSAANVRLSVESVRFFEQFERRVGSPLHFVQSGYLFLIPTRAQADAFAASAAMQQTLGVPAELLTPDELSRRWPAIDPDGLEAASFCATDGWSSTLQAVRGFIDRARALGVRVVEGCEVTGVSTDRGRVNQVRLGDRTIATDTVVNAAGPWAGEVGKLAGVELPITPRPRQVFEVSYCESLGDELPFAVDLGTGVYVHQRAGQTILGGGDRERPPSLNATVDWTGFEGVKAAAERRVPAVAQAELVSGRAGLRDMTPDDHAILGPAPESEGFWNAAGFSGHGFMHAPAVGRVLAEWITQGSPSDFDLLAFGLERFRSGTQRHEQAVF